MLFDVEAALLDLCLGPGAGFIHGLIAGLRGLLAASFLVFEYFLAGFAQALLVFGGSGLGSGDIGARFFHRALSTVTALGEDDGKRAMDEEGVENVKRRQKDDGGHGSEQ